VIIETPFLRRVRGFIFGVIKVERKKRMEKIDEKILPQDWGNDSLSEFMINAHRNIVASFVNLKPQYIRLGAINDSYKRITENLLNVRPLIPAFFLFRSHASYLGAVRLVLSGQLPETYMVLRGCLENSLYALHIYKIPGLSEIWSRRHDDEDSLKKCKENFRIVNIFKTLETEDDGLCKTARMLYETTIDYGGHPNEASLSSIIRKSEDESKIDFRIPYLIDYRLNPEAFGLGLKSSARIGVCVLLIFKLIFRERFDILGISDNLKNLKKGL